jgi:hypothetical protein
MIVDLTTADFVAALRFSPQVQDAQIRSCIREAYTFELLPLLGHDTLERLLLLPTFAPVPEYAGPAGLPALALNQLVSRRERLYQALQAAPTQEPPVQASVVALLQAGYPPAPVPEAGGQWLFKRLETLWQVYLKPYWLSAAYVRFLLNHGINVTAAGLTVPVDRLAGTYDRPSANQVAALLADASATAEARLARLTRFLKYQGLLYFYDPETGAGSYGSRDGYERVPGDAPGPAGTSQAGDRRRTRHGSALRGI